MRLTAKISAFRVVYQTPPKISTAPGNPRQFYLTRSSQSPRRFFIWGSVPATAACRMSPSLLSLPSLLSFLYKLRWLWLSLPFRCFAPANPNHFHNRFISHRGSETQRFLSGGGAPRPPALPAFSLSSIKRRSGEECACAEGVRLAEREARTAKRPQGPACE